MNIYVCFIYIKLLFCFAFLFQRPEYLLGILFKQGCCNRVRQASQLPRAPVWKPLPENGWLH